MWQLIVLASLALIFIQDLKERQVWLFLFPVFALAAAALFFLKIDTEIYFLTVTTNLLIVLFLLLVNTILARLLFKKRLLTDLMAWGDVLFFIGFALAFPTVSFIIFFVASLIFSGLLHLLFQKLQTKQLQGVPLAGHMAVFLMMVYLTHWVGLYESLYLI